MKMCRWSKAATSLVCREISSPLPNTSPDMSPTPAQVKSCAKMSWPSSAKCRATITQAPRAVMPMPLWS